MADPETDAAAGEYVLGTLDGEERRAFLRLLARDPGAVEAVIAWQERLSPLALAVPPVAPPEALYPRIVAAIDGGPVAANDNRARRWQLATLAASLVALVAAGLAFQQSGKAPPPAPAPIVAQAAPAMQPMAIAALSKGGSTPVLFIAYDRATGHVEVMPTSVDADRAHSLELWLIQGKAAPKPVGLIDPLRHAQLKTPDRVLPNAVFAVSREPIGGSPTGLPTGPVLWTGALVHL